MKEYYVTASENCPICLGEGLIKEIVRDARGWTNENAFIRPCLCVYREDIAPEGGGGTGPY